MWGLRSKWRRLLLEISPPQLMASCIIDAIPGELQRLLRSVAVPKQTGSEITGTVGPDEGEQHAITRGKIEGDKITLECANGGLSIKFDLTLVGDRITGDANVVGEDRKFTAKVDLTRAK